MKLQIFLITLFSTLPFSMALAQTPEKTTNPQHPFAKQLETIYLKYLESARRGDVSATLRVMTSEYAQMAKQITPELLKGMSADDLDPQKSQFIRIDVSKKKNMARAIYQKLGPERKDWTAILFKKESGAWKIAKIVRQVRTGSETGDGLQELLNDTNSFLQDP